MQVSGLAQTSAERIANQHSSLGWLKLCAPLIPFIFMALETTHPRSLVTTAAHSIMIHVLTDVRSRRAHRLSSFLFISSHVRNQTLLIAALHRSRPLGAARDGGRGVYFEDPSGHLLEILTRPYGSGG